MNTRNTMGPTGGQGDPARGGQRPPRWQVSGRGWIWVIVAVFLFNLLFYALELGSNMQKTNPSVTLPYSSFISQVNAGNIRTAAFSGDNISGEFRHTFKDSSTGKQYQRYSSVVVSELVNSTVTLLDRKGTQVTLQSQTVPPWVNVLGFFLQGLPFLFLIGLFWFGSRAARQQQQGVFGFGQSRAKLYNEEKPSTTFADVAGVNTAKGELNEIVDFLRDPSKYHRLGARIPKGALLVGPPGTGKTLLARAVAGEANVPFLSISATEFVELFVGVGASRVRDLFDRAKAVSPSIVFIDEIDAIGGARGGRGPLAGSNDEREQTLNQLLVSMDGFETNEAVIILAATNRPDVLDPALLRPGRFDRQVVVDPPDRQGREAILKIHTRMIPLATDVDLESLARSTPGMSGADLANLANEAALTAARNGHAQVTRSDFDVALDRITLGAEGTALMDEEERRTVAYHEGGHTLVAFMLPNVDPVNRVTITPRGRSLGVTQFMPVDDRRNYRRDFLLNRMAVGMGGRAAEEVACAEITSGAQNDLQMITGIARTMVTELGMADELGPAYFGPGDGSQNGHTFNPFDPKPYSDETGERIDGAVMRLVNEAHERALTVLRENRATLDAIARALIQEESLNREQVTAIVNAHLPPGHPPLPVPTGPPTPTGETPPELLPPVEAPPAGSS